MYVLTGLYEQSQGPLLLPLVVKIPLLLLFV
jgi:hypothetical protein